jgi:hypothetical protein
MGVWYGLWSFGTVFPNLVCLDQEKSGNPEIEFANFASAKVSEISVHLFGRKFSVKSIFIHGHF